MRTVNANPIINLAGPNDSTISFICGQYCLSRDKIENKLEIESKLRN